MSGVNISKCATCGKVHQVRLRAHKKLAKEGGEWSKWQTVCSIECLEKLPLLSDPSCVVEGLDDSELRQLGGKEQKNVIDAEFSE